MNYNISLTQGEDYSLSQTVTGSDGNAIDFSGYSIRGKVGAGSGTVSSNAVCTITLMEIAG